MNTRKITLFIQLLRPRTLLLSLMTVLIGNVLALSQGFWRLKIFVLCLTTALSLQILSNIANDYGDGIRGTDVDRRHAPPRLLAAKLITAREMQIAMLCAAIIAAFSGLSLLRASVHDLQNTLLFMMFGGLSLIAAIKYTVGKFAYGYYALGEVFVLIFFGWLGVIGSYYMQTQQWQSALLLPASGNGLLAAAVLNVNNIRDIDSDKRAHKITIATLLGFSKSIYFHFLLLFAAVSCYAIFAFTCGSYTALCLLLILPYLVAHLRRMSLFTNANQAAAELRVIIILNVVINLLFCALILINV